MSAPSFDYVVTGAGVVGLAAALEFKKRKPGAKIAVFEKEIKPGLHASGRNSGVLHSGIYYRPGTLKARMCTRGAALMREFAQRKNIPLLTKGKLIVALRDEDLAGIRRLTENAAANGVRFEKLDADNVRKIEPFARAHKEALFIPDTAVVDCKQVMQSLAAEAQDAGIELHLGESVQNADPSKNELCTSKGSYRYGFLINCAGAYADKIASYFGVGGNAVLVPFKGIYFQLRPERRSLVNSNIYPVPDENMPFLGVHFTRLPSGEVHVGPTAIPALSRENYGLLNGFRLSEFPSILTMLIRMYFSPDAVFRNLVHREISHYFKPVFFKSAQKMVPSLKYEDLVECHKVGIRPQIVDIKTGNLINDYRVEPGKDSLHILNAISPAFTSAFAFAEYLYDRTQNR